MALRPELSPASLIKLTSFLCWSWSYVYCAAKMPGKSPEWYSRAVTLIHGSVATAAGFLQCNIFNITPEDLTSKITTANYALMVWSWGYFAFDFLWSIIYWTDSYVMLVHHLSALIAINIYMGKDYTGCFFPCTMVLMEITNPLLQTRWFLRYEGYDKNILYYVVEIIYLTLFIGLRGVCGTYLTFKILHSDTFDMDEKLITLVFYIVSLIFVSQIIGYVAYKYKTKIDFAETAMNELLGWYGYERLELRRWAASRAREPGSPEHSEQKNKDECSWCHKSVTSDSGALQQAGAVFCSELCFSQSRRANFKRAKTCDWCRHVRHTVAYVDFQDGATQLQFCSDKCLNQYKMHIFCRETQAHLDLNPHLMSASSTSNLITPELWLKNCKSRSVSPSSERSGSPTEPKNDKPETSQRKSPLPLITIAPTAKLMNPKPPEEKPFTKSPESKKEPRNKMNLRKRRTSKCTSTVTSQSLKQRSTTPKAQDLRMRSPSIDASSPASSVTIGNSAIHSPPNPQMPFNPYGMPPPGFLDHMNDFNHPRMFPPRFGFMPPRPMMQERPRFIPPNFSQAIGQPPPVTVLVPYPVILPIPLPIPVPIPLTTFLKAHQLNKMKTEVDDTEGPLDFTINSDKNEKPKEPDVTKDTEENIENKETDRLQEDKSEVPEPNPEQTLPKFKITRLGNKMAKIVAKAREASESSRPLRKRRRLVEVSTDDETLIPKTRKIVEV